MRPCCTHQCQAWIRLDIPAKSNGSASHRTGNLTGTTEKSDAAGVFGKAGRVDTICIPLRDVGPTAEKLYLLDIDLI